MARTPRNVTEASYCTSAMKHLIYKLEAKGLTHRAINDALHFGPFEMGGDALGNTVSRDKAGRRVKSIIDIDKSLRTFVAQGVLTPPSNALDQMEHILFGSIEHMFSNSDQTTIETDELIKDQANFEKWIKGRARKQAYERRALRTRIQAFQKAADRLLQLLDSINGSGHDGWDCSPSLPDTLTAHHFSQAGNQISWAQRNVLLWLITAAKGSAAQIKLHVSYWHGSHCTPRLAGCYHPIPPEVPDQVLAKEMAELGIDPCNKDHQAELSAGY